MTFPKGNKVKVIFAVIWWCKGWGVVWDKRRKGRMDVNTSITQQSNMGSFSGIWTQFPFSYNYALEVHQNSFHLLYIVWSRLLMPLHKEHMSLHMLHILSLVRLRELCKILSQVMDFPSLCFCSLLSKTRGPAWGDLSQTLPGFSTL